MTDRTQSYARAVVELATGEGALDTVEDELLVVARAVDDREELRQRLTDRNSPVGQRLAVIESDVLSAVHPGTRAALAMIIAGDRTGDISAIASAVAEQAAATRDSELAEVFVAVPLDETQQRALKEALERATGKRLDIKVHVDENVVGGVRARIGDTVIDGSLSRRIEELRTRIGR